MRTILFIAFLLVTHTAQAQRSVKGTILDGQTGEPVPYALVVSGIQKAYSNSTGNFTIAVSPSDTILKILASFYEEGTLVLREEFEYTLFLKPEDQNLEAITVTALRLESSLLGSTGPVSILTASQIATKFDGFH
jgi:hypothetical protein